jgi:hypothetical protein
MDEYNAIVQRLRTERCAYLATFDGLRSEIVNAVS